MKMWDVNRMWNRLYFKYTWNFNWYVNKGTYLAHTQRIHIISQLKAANDRIAIKTCYINPSIGWYVYLEWNTSNHYFIYFIFSTIQSILIDPPESIPQLLCNWTLQCTNILKWNIQSNGDFLTCNTLIPLKISSQNDFVTCLIILF